MFVRPWEELAFNKDRHDLGYEKLNIFHIPNYSKPVHFVSAGLLEEVNNIENKCQHCHRVGHWRHSSLISILIFILGRQITSQKSVERRIRLRKQLIMDV
jgi:hypothetical protein